MTPQLLFRLFLSVQASLLLPFVSTATIAAAPLGTTESVRTANIEIDVIDRDRGTADPVLMARQNDYDYDSGNRGRNRNSNNDYDYDRDSGQGRAAWQWWRR